MRTDEDKRLKRYSVYQKMINMKDLLAKIFFREQKFLHSLKKSRTPTITAVIKSNITNRYNSEWTKKNLIDEDQLEDWYTKFYKDQDPTQNPTMCDYVGIYLKQLYIIITGNENGLPDKQYYYKSKIFKCDSEFPELSKENIDNENNTKLTKIFDPNISGNIMHEFIDNYNLIRKNFNPTGRPVGPIEEEGPNEEGPNETQDLNIVEGGTRRRKRRTVKRTKK